MPVALRPVLSVSKRLNRGAVTPVSLGFQPKVWMMEKTMQQLRSGGICLHATRQTGPTLDPEVGVEVSVADGFGEVFFIDRWFAGKIGDRSGNSQNFVVGSGGKAQRFHPSFEQRLAGRAQFTVLPRLTAAHLGVVSYRTAFESFGLHVASTHDGFTHHRTGLARRIARRQLFKRYRGNLDVNVNAI